MLNCIELFRLSKVRLFVGGYQLNFQSLLVRLCKGLFFLSRLDKVVDDSACVVVTLESPTERIFGGFEKSNSSCTLFWDMIVDVFAVHIFLSEIATFILENFTIKR